MRKEDARAIMDSSALLPGVLSKRVLKDICEGTLGAYGQLSADHHEQLTSLLSEYRAKLASLGTDVRPKNLPFYLLLKDRYPNLGLHHVGGQVQLESYFRGLKPSILSLLLGLVPP